MAEPHPEMLAAFERWRLAELASHYANNCPDDLMNHLVDVSGEKLLTVASLPATSADDVLLKLAMLAVIELEPKCGEPPMDPRDPDKVEHLGGNLADIWRGILVDLNALCPAFAAARLAPHYSELRRSVPATKWGDVS